MDELGKRIQEASPYAARTLPPSGEALLTALRSRRTDVRSEAARGSARKSWRRRPLLLSASAAMGFALVLTFVLVSILGRPQAVIAATPEPLMVQSSETTVGALREDLNMSENASASASHLGAEYDGWYLQLDENHTHDFVQPQVVHSILQADGSVVTQIRSGDAFTADGKIITDVPVAAEARGALLSEVRWEHREFVGAFTQTPPNDTAGMRAYLEADLRQRSAGSAPELLAADYADAATSLLETWTLSPQAQRALVQVILNAPGVTALGTTIDRAGRPGTVLAFDPGALAASDSALRLVIDTSQWRIIGAETITTVDIPEHSIPAHAVTSYTIWR